MHKISNAVGLFCLMSVSLSFGYHVADNHKKIMGYKYSSSHDFSMPLAWNKPYSIDNCNDPKSSVTVFLENEPYCVRYFASDKAVNAERVLFVLYGDKDKNDTKDISDITRNTVFEQRNYLMDKEEKYNLPVIVIARIGTYGSSGKQKQKRQLKEYQLINLAIEQLKFTFKFNKMTFLGHSGGATIGAGLLTLGRKDIDCYVLTSGAYDLENRFRWFRKIRGWIPKSPPKNYYDPLNHVKNIENQADTRVFLLANKKDNRAGYLFQEKMYDALVKQGINAYLILSDAHAPDYHNLKNDAGFQCAKLCSMYKQQVCGLHLLNTD